MSTPFLSQAVLVASLAVGVISVPAHAGPGPCGCDSDVNNVGGVDAVDVAIIADCARDGTCGGCVDSCDVDCDGDVDYYDAGVAACAFQGFSDCCNDADGACTGATVSGTPPCILTTDNLCGLFGGTYQGDNTICVGDQAVDIPAASTWGLAVMSLGLVIGATLLLRPARVEPVV